ATAATAPTTASAAAGSSSQVRAGGTRRPSTASGTTPAANHSTTCHVHHPTARRSTACRGGRRVRAVRALSSLVGAVTPAMLPTPGTGGNAIRPPTRAGGDDAARRVWCGSWPDQGSGERRQVGRQVRDQARVVAGPHAVDRLDTRALAAHDVPRRHARGAAPDQQV